MATYVDDMKAPYGRMIMCHLVADSDEELHAMAAKIGVARRWHQKPGTDHSHYDICMSKRAKAVTLGAKEVTMRDIGLLIRQRRKARLAQSVTPAARPDNAQRTIQTSCESGVPPGPARQYD